MTTATATTEQAIEIGSIFVASWGYDQTNVDAYQVISRTAKTVTVRPIETNEIADGATSMTGKATPIADAFTGPAMRRKLKTYDDKPFVVVGHCQYAYLHTMGEVYRTTFYC